MILAILSPKIKAIIAVSSKIIIILFMVYSDYSLVSTIAVAPSATTQPCRNLASASILSINP